MPDRDLIRFLDKNHVKYQTITHSTAYTAQEIAAKAHVPGREMAKTVIVKIDDELVMVVLPATAKVDLTKLRIIDEAHTLELATEDEFKDRFPGCSAGAMPPFGNLYRMRVFVDESLAEDEEIAFNAGFHTELVRMAYRDFERLVRPRVASLALKSVAA